MENNIIPEMIKVIAEGMGYEILTNCHGRWVVNKGEGSGVWEYNPLTNAEQDSEIEIKLGITTSYIREGLWQAIVVKRIKALVNSTLEYEGRGETPTEARCNAAFEYFDNQ